MRAGNKSGPSNDTVSSGAGYTLDQLKASERYCSQKDILDALLDRDKPYSLQEVDGIIEKFMKGRVE